MRDWLVSPESHSTIHCTLCLGSSNAVDCEMLYYKLHIMRERGNYLTGRDDTRLPFHVIGWKKRKEGLPVMQRDSDFSPSWDKQPLDFLGCCRFC